jgi:prepilin-type N-terminal cleavage/methylation domain-containing protein
MTMSQDDRGFTLMEALVGLLILTLGLTALFAAFSGSVEAVRRSERRELAVETARSLIAGIGVVSPLVAGIRNGRSAEGLSWQVEIKPRQVSEILTAQPRIDAYWINVTVQDGFGATHLTTLKIAQPP